MMPKDQTICPKCHRIYCEGYWGEGVCTADMYFSSEPTSAGDAAADYLRQWYEAHRESWWDRSRFNSRNRQWEWASDNLMLGLMSEVHRIQRVADEEAVARRSGRGKAAAEVDTGETDADRFRDALERIALLDEADGYELTWETASEAVAIACRTLGKHPSEIQRNTTRRLKRDKST